MTSEREEKEASLYRRKMKPYKETEMLIGCQLKQIFHGNECKILERTAGFTAVSLSGTEGLATKDETSLCYELGHGESTAEVRRLDCMNEPVEVLEPVAAPEDKRNKRPYCTVTSVTLLLLRNLFSDLFCICK